MQNLHQLTQDYEILYANRFSNDDQLLVISNLRFLRLEFNVSLRLPGIHPEDGNCNVCRNVGFTNFQFDHFVNKKMRMWKVAKC
jgi:hypothetical protein